MGEMERAGQVSGATPMSRKSGETWGTPFGFGPQQISPENVGFSRFGKILSSPPERRFWGQLADSMGEIKLDNLTVDPYAK